MWRFIRRVFMLLVLFTIVFLVYRYINPVSANNFVEKIKAIPNNIVNMFSSQNELIITDTTVGITWDFDSWSDLWLNIDDQKIEEKEDVSWLEELNKEIESILWKNQNTIEDEELVENELNEEDNIEIEDIFSWDNDNLLDDKSNKDNWEVVEDNQSNQEIKIEDWLSANDYKQIEDVFWNLVE